MIVIRIIWQTLFFALAQLHANKIRSLLTMLGIIIGVSSITLVIAAVNGLNDWVLSEFESFGARKVEIWGSLPASQRGVMSWDTVKLKPSEADQMREHCELIETLALYANVRAKVRSDREQLDSVTVIGVEPEWLVVNDREVLHGRPLKKLDDLEQLQVCMINDTAIDELMLDGVGVGEYIFIDERRFLIVGVLDTVEFGAMFGADTARSEVYIPFRTTYKLRNWLWPQITARMKSSDNVENAKAEIRYVLRRIRQLGPEDEDTFDMFVFEQVLQRLRGMAAGLTMVASVLVSISLLVGGVGIMNIMLVSVSERTREIGLRKAVGARPAIILMQFLVEAIVLCVVGGIIGLVLSQSMLLAASQIPDMPITKLEIPTWAIGLSFCFCAVVGVVFGMWPAIKAASLDPIEALRHE
ncbi:ABC transporter permease [Pyruvatibacter sp.]|uniref:ABC transporter permease n=1 Tax=Pyruvatibacter sp. TaxID=1981328 RepID=UPI0032EE8BC7